MSSTLELAFGRRRAVDIGSDERTRDRHRVPQVCEAAAPPGVSRRAVQVVAMIDGDLLIEPRK
jgi:hypothetical protein